MTDKVLDFVAKRNENIEQKRRNFERILFKNFLGAYSVIDQDGGHYEVELVDVSRTGCLFQVPTPKNPPTRSLVKGEEVRMRIYFTQNSFIPLILNVTNIRQTDNEGEAYTQYGCEFDKSMPSFEAMESFIEFLYKFAEFSTVDKGDGRVYFL